jgi:MFS family permease
MASIPKITTSEDPDTQSLDKREAPASGSHVEKEEGKGPLPLSRDFRLLWGGQVISSLGSAISAVAVPLVAITVLGATPFQMGVLSAAQSSPSVLLAVAAGVLADRVRKRTILFITNGGRAILMLAIGVMISTGQLRLGTLCVIVFCASALGVFYDVTYTAVIPLVAKREQLIKANTVIQGGRAASGLIGRGLSGILVSLFTAQGALYIDAFSFLVCFASVWLMKPQEIRTKEAASPTVWVDLREGFRFVLGQPHIRALTGYAATANMCIGGLFAVYVLYLSRDLGVAPGFIGLILATLGAGSLLGTVIVPRFIKKVGLGVVLTVSSAVTAGATWLLVIKPGCTACNITIQILGLILFGSSAAVVSVNINGLAQAITPSRLMARIFGIMQFLGATMMPLGALASGALGQYAGLSTSIHLVAGGFLASVLWFVLSPLLKVHSIPSVNCEPDEVPEETH